MHPHCRRRQSDRIFYLSTHNSRTIPRYSPPTSIRRGAEDRILALFPHESRALIHPGVTTVHKVLAGKPKDPKRLGTVRSRRIQYLIFCYNLNLHDDWNLSSAPQERANFQLALCYAAHLAAGNLN